jgi:hypothetical protein
LEAWRRMVRSDCKDDDVVIVALWVSGCAHVE